MAYVILRNTREILERVVCFFYFFALMNGLVFFFSIQKVSFSEAVGWVILENTVKTLVLIHPDISIHILHTVLFTIPKVLTRRIYLTVKSFFLIGDHFLYSHDLNG